MLICFLRRRNLDEIWFWRREKCHDESSYILRRDFVDASSKSNFVDERILGIAFRSFLCRRGKRGRKLFRRESCFSCLLHCFSVRDTFRRFLRRRNLEENVVEVRRARRRESWRRNSTFRQKLISGTTKIISLSISLPILWTSLKIVESLYQNVNE